MKNEGNKIKRNRDFTTQTLDANLFNQREVGEQYSIVERILRSAYETDTEISKSWVLNAIDVIDNNQNDFICLPENLCVEKNNGVVTFEFRKRSRANIFLLMLYILLFVLGLLLAAYWGIFYLNKVNLNKDIDNDGIADLNLDINKDGKAEINIDTNRDNKPDLNIDYKGNRKATFNLDKNNDGKADFNLVQDATHNKKCDLNCDSDGDGWPDYSIDIDGDGEADLDIDTDGDQKPDLNIDEDGNGKCDLNCDTNGDLKCDKYCTDDKKEVKRSGPTSVTGNPDNNVGTGGLIINYTSEVGATTNVLPDDMQNSKPIPPREFTVENTSSFSIAYRLIWQVKENSFVSENLKYQLVSKDGGFNSNLTTVPTLNGNKIIQRNIIIPAGGMHHYSLNFRLIGTNTEQNEDQGKTFSGYITAEYDEQ